MRHAVIAALALVIAAVAPLRASGPPAEVAVSWAELGTVVNDRKVALGLPDGTYIEGKVRMVEPGGLRLRVTKTSDRAKVAKGERLIPKAAVSTLRVNRYRKIGRILGVAAAVGGAAIAIAANDIDVYEGVGLIVVPAVAVGGTIGLGVGGYYIGKQFDKRVVLVRVRE
jgi:hypothetical protein